MHASPELKELFHRPELQSLYAQEGFITHYGAWIDTVAGAPTHAHVWRQAKKQRVIKELLFRGLLADVDGLFHRNKMPAILFKGLSMAHRYYAEPLHRSFGDLDVLVRDTDWEHAHELLLEAGAEPEPEGKWKGTVFRRVYHLQDAHLELHRNLLIGRDLPELFSDGSWTRASCVPGVHWLREMEPHVLFVYLCGHGAFQHLFDELYWLVDLDLLLRKESEALDWSRIRVLAKRLRLEKAVGASLSVLDKHLKTPLPEVARYPRIGSALLNRLLPLYVTPVRVLHYAHQPATPIYRLFKGMLRDSPFETLEYALRRTFQF